MVHCSSNQRVLLFVCEGSSVFSLECCGTLIVQLSHEHRNVAFVEGLKSLIQTKCMMFTLRNFVNDINYYNQGSDPTCRCYLHTHTSQFVCTLLFFFNPVIL